jgi:hypothetical protein
MHMNLISVSSICDLGHTVTFTSTKCTVNQNNVVILTALRLGGLYVFRVPLPRQDFNALQAVCPPDAQLQL